MKTWRDVVAHLEDGYQIIRREEGALTLLWQFDAGGGRQAQVRQKVSDVVFAGRPWLLVVCDVAADSDLSPYEVLARNMALAVGALAVHEKRIVLRHAHDLDAGAAALDAALLETAREAARTRVTARRPAASGSPVFQMYEQ